MKKYLAICAFVILGACAHNHQAPSYYTLAENAGGVAISSKKMSVDVGRIKVPEYIDRSQIVTTDGAAVTVAENERWAERVGPMTERRIMSGLRARLTGATVKSADFIGAPTDYSVFVEIYRLDGTIPGNVVLDATYSIVENGTPVKTRRVEYADTCGDSYSDYVHAIGGLVDKLSRDISRDLVRLAK
ncbi:MAG: PqiC family protein [Alphaproteobacteria bacterium]|nr:PqiC family protein [Alphaproteobacteria bacterium]